MGFKEMVQEYASAKHSGFHYVPSFSDFNSNSNDDVDADMCGKGLQKDTGAAPNTQPKRMSNKTDSLPAVDPLVTEIDLHKVGRAIAPAGKKMPASWNYDIVKPGSPSVWQYIIEGQKLRDATFKAMDANKDGIVTAQELQQATGVTASQAEQAVREAVNAKKARAVKGQLQSDQGPPPQGLTYDDFECILDQYSLA